MLVLIVMFGSQLFAQDAPKSILDFTKVNFPSEVTIPIPWDSLVYVNAPLSVLNLEVQTHRVDNDPESVFSFCEVGSFSVMETKMNDRRTSFSVIRI